MECYFLMEQKNCHMFIRIDCIRMNSISTQNVNKTRLFSPEHHRTRRFYFHNNNHILVFFMHVEIEGIDSVAIKTAFCA